jgi:hypothetical protein
MGDIQTKPGTGGNQQQLMYCASKTLANERFLQLSGEAREYVETCIHEHVSQIELSLKNISVEQFAQTDWNDLTKIDFAKFEKVSYRARNMTGWPHQFEDEKKKAASVPATIEKKKAASGPAPKKKAASSPDPTPTDKIPTPRELEKIRMDASIHKAEADTKVLSMDDDIKAAYISLLGFVPIWERTQFAHYMMDCWGMDHLKKKDAGNVLLKKEITLQALSETNQDCSQSAYVQNTHGQAGQLLNRLVVAALVLVLKDEQLLDFVASSGVVRTGTLPKEEEEAEETNGGEKKKSKSKGKSKTKAALKSDKCPRPLQLGQEVHTDNYKALKHELFRMIMKGELEVDKDTLIGFGYVADLPLSERGRVTKFAIPDPENKRWKIVLRYTPYGTITVRHMTVLHSGHGGKPGDAVWHCTIVPKTHVKNFDGDRLGYIRYLAQAGGQAARRQFNGWTLRWDDQYSNHRMNDLSNWDQSVDKAARHASARYSNSVWEPFKTNPGSMMARWLCSPNDPKIRSILCKILKAKGVSVQTVPATSEDEEAKSGQDDNDASGGGNTQRASKVAARKKNQKIVAPKEKDPVHRTKIGKEGEKLAFSYPWSWGMEVQQTPSTPVASEPAVSQGNKQHTLQEPGNQDSKVPEMPQEQDQEDQNPQITAQVENPSQPVEEQLERTATGSPSLHPTIFLPVAENWDKIPEEFQVGAFNDGNGAAMWMDSLDGSVFPFRRNPDGTWSPPVSL